MKQQIPQQKRIQIGKFEVSRKLVIWLCVAIAIIVAGWFVDYSAKQRFASLKNEIAAIERDFILPAEGLGLFTEFTGQDFFNTTGCIDVECPSFHQGWMVPLEDGSEQAFIESLIRRAGYASKADSNPCKAGDFCLREGRKDGKFRIMITAHNPKDSRRPIPEKDVSPKKWRFVDIHLNLDRGL